MFDHYKGSRGRLLSRVLRPNTLPRGESEVVSARVEEVEDHCALGRDGTVQGREGGIQARR